MKKRYILLYFSIFILFGFNSNHTNAVDGELIIINKSKNELAFFENGKLVRVFSVATGRQASYTPEGTFKIVNKIENRPYYSGNVAGGDPNNPLGNRWLGINPRGTNGDTYAIHGNNNPSSIGTYASSGCIRMFDEDVEWLYDHVSVNTTVMITSSSNTFEAIAASIGFNTESHSTAVVSDNHFLKIGSRGSAVREIQESLTNFGYHTNGIDGVFGKQTEQAVINFQKDNGLLQDGVVGPMTKKAIGTH